MSRRVAVLESLHCAALAFWLSAIVLSAGAAAILFPLMHTLDPRLPEYATYTGPHWSLAAGAVANRIFAISGVISLAAAAVALGALFGLFAGGALGKRAGAV